jgi:acetoin utilization protein AcuB
VVDDQNAVVGLITDRDLRSMIVAPAVEQYLSRAARRRLRAIAGTFENLKVKDAMTNNPITTTPQASVSQATAIMLERRIGSLPVIENGKLVGIVTDRDAVKALAIHPSALKYAAEVLW